MSDSYEFLKGHYDRIRSEQREREKECGEDHVIGERPDDCFACLSEQRDELLAALKLMLHASPASGWEQSNARKAAAAAVAKWAAGGKP